MRKYFVPQLNHKGCALACVQMIMYINGINLSKEKRKIIEKITNIMTVYDIVQILEKFNIGSNVYYEADFNIKKIINILPVVIHFSNHFAILYEIKNNKCLVADPSKIFIKSIDLSKIEKRWSGYLVKFSVVDNKWQDIFHKTTFIFPYLVKFNLFYILIIFLIYICFSKL
ncbi:MAG: cysteine peptidase family C39 domain-containing protein [Bacilli bacterium]|nr:cysteine peptidase family C39 domain-containing protein [Bacilli bacterium]